MSSILVITLIIILLAGLVCYAFVSQTIQQKREQKKRLTAALKSQSRSFKFMLNGCPTGFLTKELTILVHRSIIEVSEQLSRLEPNEPIHPQEAQTFGNMLTETQRMPARAERVPLSNPQQVKDVKMSLEELHRFVFNLEGQRRLNRQQADAYRAQIKQLVLQLTIDGYLLHGRQAQENEKYKLALHYYDSAERLIVRDDKTGNSEQKLQVIRANMAKMRELMDDDLMIPIPGATEEEQADLAGEWDKFGENKGDWKKKQVYD
ncbi:MAG: type II secretory pathway pseudopilin PulG [Flavobacteriales bacterium]|jgi:type II secretory pathway pseudopilin PulG